MASKKGELITSPSSLIIEDNLTVHEHHNIYVKVTDYVSSARISIEDYTIANLTGDSDDTINLNAQEETELLTSSGTYSFLIENKRVTALRINYLSGDAKLEIFYEGW